MADYSAFDLDRTIDEAWRAFGLRLSDVIASMDGTGDLTIDSVDPAVHDAGTPQVSFHLVSPGTVRAEVSADAELTDPYRLDDVQIRALIAAGWQAPPAAGEQSADQPRAGEAEGPSSGRFWVEDSQEESDRLAELAVIALRDVFGVQHPAFLAPDQLAEILTQRQQEPFELDVEDIQDVRAVVPASREHLEAMVVDQLTDMLGHQPLQDEDGDYALRVGSTMAFVRTTPDAREVVVFAVIVHDVEGRSRAAEVLNDLNAESRFVRFELVRDKVFVQMSVLARPFVPAHLQQAVRTVSAVADSIDETLASNLRGRTTFR